MEAAVSTIKSVHRVVSEMPIAFVTGHVTPYNRRLFEAFVDLTREDLHVFSCTGTEPHRSWIVGEPRNFSAIASAR